jgi:hypothetical protein
MELIKLMQIVCQLSSLCHLSRRLPEARKVLNNLPIGWEKVSLIMRGLPVMAIGFFK